MDRRPRIVVVGGGASGALVALQLLRQAGGTGRPVPDVVVIEPRAVLGRGAAFSAGDPWHRLNVPALTMTALPDDPDHFRRWAGVPPGAFPSRSVFGRYLSTLLTESARTSPARLRHVRGSAHGLAPTPNGYLVTTDRGRELVADAVVLATGNTPPAVPGPLLPLVSDPRLVTIPWARGALDGVIDGETVAIVGTGHTALDLAASVLRRRAGCRVVAVSRHGDLPRAHQDPWRPRLPAPVVTVGEFAAAADPLAMTADRIRARGDDWRRAFDSLRPITPTLWQAMDDTLRRRFLADWRRTWEVHRSRVSAAVMRDVRGWVDTGRLEIRAGGIERVDVVGARLMISGPGGSSGPGGRGWPADRILLATGPDEAAAANPLLASTIAQGLLAPGPLGLGLDADPATLQVRDRSGSVMPSVYAIGPLLRGVLWETIAIPEIRAQAVRIAGQILAATPVR